MAYHNHDLKRLQPTTHSSEYNLSIDDNEAMKEFVQQFSITYNNINKHFPPFKPGPHRARRGGGNGRAYDRNFFSSVSLPKRAIHYDLAESFMDHSTNPLSSNLYKLPSNTQIKKSNSINNVTKSSDLIALLNENKEDNPCS
ncbi:unnamed protein product [Rotaria socialis]|uniref:Uncharacterized protein n=1 Tax=Rotaria socialis TaxID=392032 RepID=A0A820YRQ4_9BILA|nr:unnamed protein product [Rotaria socialis]